MGPISQGNNGVWQVSAKPTSNVTFATYVVANTSTMIAPIIVIHLVIELLLLKNCGVLSPTSNLNTTKKKSQMVFFNLHCAVTMLILINPEKRNPASRGCSSGNYKQISLQFNFFITIS